MKKYVKIVGRFDDITSYSPLIKTEDSNIIDAINDGNYVYIGNLPIQIPRMPLVGKSYSVYLCTSDDILLNDLGSFDDIISYLSNERNKKVKYSGGVYGSM